MNLDQINKQKLRSNFLSEYSYISHLKSASETTGRRIGDALLSMPLWFYVSVAIVAHLLRSPEALLNPQFYAEDGAVFFIEDHNLGPSAIFKTYAGYYHLWPRILSLLVGFLPLFWIPLVDRLLGVFTHLIILSYLCSERFSASRSQKILIILIPSLVPHMGEVYLNLANTISFCCLLTAIVFLCEPPSGSRIRVCESFLLFVMACSGPYCFFLLPLLGVCLFSAPGRLRSDWQRFSFYAAGTIVQAAGFSSKDRPIPEASKDIEAWSAAFEKFFRPLLFSDFQFPPAVGFWLALFVVSAIVVSVASSLSRAGRNSQRNSFATSLMPAAVFLILCGLANQSASLFIGRSNPAIMDPFRYSARYFFVSYVFILWGLALASGSLRMTIFRRALIVIALINSLFHFSSRFSVDDLHWKAQVQKYQATGYALVKILPQPWLFELEKWRSWRAKLWRAVEEKTNSTTSTQH